jgi:hypothetical protein
LTLFVFLLISAPFIASISHAKGKLTFGEAGKLTYIKYVNDVPYPHWQGETPDNSTPRHPSRKIFDDPPIYEFGTPIGGTYPICYDPSYWYEGVVSRFDSKQLIRQLISSALFYFDMFFRQQGALVAGILLLYLMSRWQPLRIRDIVQQWGLALLALTAFGMYAVVYVEGRYIGVFLMLFWADLLANVRLPESNTSKRLAALLSVVMILFMLMNIVAFNLEGYNSLTGDGNRNQLANIEAGPPSWPGEVAEVLHRLGVQPGEKVAVIGYAFESFWARLAKVKIVAEMFEWEADRFWLGDSLLQSKAFQAFAGTGAKAIVAEHVPSYVSLTDWHQVGTSSCYVYILAQ